MRNYLGRHVYKMLPDDRSSIGASYCIHEDVHWDYFFDKPSNYELIEPLQFEIREGEFQGDIGDYQINNCGFYMFSPKLKTIIDGFLTDIDIPKWFKAEVIDLTKKRHLYFILHFFQNPDLLDYKNSTFMDKEKTNPIKKRYDIKKIGERKIFGSEYGSSFMVHKQVRQKIKDENCFGIYFYGIHKAGRLM